MSLRSASITTCDEISDAMPELDAVSARARSIPNLAAADNWIHRGLLDNSPARYSTSDHARAAEIGSLLVRFGSAKAQEAWLSAPVALSS